MDKEIAALTKAELHVHIEGTVTPEKCRELATKNGVALADDLFTPDGAAYHYSDFIDLVTRVYQNMARCVRTREDFEEITYDYLSRCAAENTLYVELIACPGQTHLVGISYADMIDGIADGIDRARADHGIEARINVTFERHRAAEAEADADMILSYQHPYIVGLDIAGGEMPGDIEQFRPAYERVLNEFGRWLGRRMHASENVGPDNARDAMSFGVTRIGHGIQIIDDPVLLGECIRDNVTLEVCPTSNILALKTYCPDFAAHPLRKLFDRGVMLCLNSDDPGLFGNSIGMEYQIAKDHFSFTGDELIKITRTAVAESFAPPELKLSLIARVDDFERARFSSFPAPGMNAAP